MKKKYVVILYNIIVVLLIFGAIEFYFEYKLSHPENLSGRLKIASQNYYMKYGRQIIQYEPEMAKYDENLFYTLKPGTFQFKNREFNVSFNVNSLGVRDDEFSLNQPKIVILGDSHAMGWGVCQKETFAEVLQESTQRNVLNTGISSYGTVREFELLKQVNKDSLQYVIIQYCDNDYNENQKYFANNNALKISSEEVYENVSSKQSNRGKYHLFKHILKFPKLIIKADPEFSSVLKPKEDEVAVFLNVIRQSEILQKEIKIIVLNINGRKTTNHFINDLKSTLQNDKWKDIAKYIIPLDVSSGLTEDNYHVLDDHINAKGHAFIADQLHKRINLFENAQMIP